MRFCHNCGKQLSVASAKFCSFCGTSLSSLDARPIPQRIPQQTIAIDQNDDDYIDRLTKLDIRINKLEFDIIKPPQIKETVGAIAATEKSPLIDPRPIAPKVAPEVVKEQFMREAGAIRPNSSSHVAPIT